MTMTAVFWLVLVIVLAVTEIATMGLTTIWFAGGALTALVLAVTGFGIPVQLCAFCIVSLVLLFCTRPWAVRYFNSREREKTNVDSLLGKTVVVTSAIDNLAGQGKVNVNGLTWTARSTDDSVKIPEGSKVTVTAVEGVKLIVVLNEEEEG